MQLANLSQIFKTMTSIDLVDWINRERRHEINEATPEGQCAIPAELRHDNFMAKLEKHPGINSPKFLGQYKDSTGRTLKCYHLLRRECGLMIMSESLLVQTRMYDRLAELEQAAPVLALPADYIQALESLLASKKSEKIAVDQLAIAAPKADALDRLTLADGSMCITNAAKSLGMQPKALFAWLQANDWIYRRPGSGSWTAYQTRLKSMFLDHKVTTIERGDGTEKITEQVLVTAKGLVKLAEVTA